jgi:plastocyanin
MRAFLILLPLLFVGYFDSNIQSTQNIQLENASIIGSVELPAATNRAVTRFRGRAYRNRTNTEAEQPGNTETTSPLRSVIISAHPISFKVDVEPLSKPVQIIQRDAVFIPQVTPVTVYSIVQFINDDPFFHNVFSLTPGAKFNIGRRPTGDVYSKEIPQLSWKVEGLGPISLYCDIHSQMSAVILSLDTPYFTRVNNDGTFILKDLPPGEYEIRAYHPKFEVVSQRIVLINNQQNEVNLSFRP